MTDTIPLFPLSHGIFPDGMLQLQIFEVRYLDLMNRCQEEHGKDIGQLNGEEQVRFLTKMNKETIADKRKAQKEGMQPRRTFLEQFKDLTKFCYCSSEVGATEALELVFVPGKWVASMPLKPDQKAWAM